MEIKRIYNDPVDENDIANKRYVDKSLKTDIDYTDIKNKPSIPDINNMGSIVVDDISCKNLFNKNNAIRNGSFTNTGVIDESSDKFVQQSYIPVESSKNYILHAGTVPDRLVICEYDENKTFIKRNISLGMYTLVIKTTSTTKYVRLCSDIAVIDTLQFEKGTMRTELTDYKKYGYNSIDSMGSIVVDDISCKNLFNKYGKLNEKFDYTTGDTTLLSDGTIKATSNYAAGNGPGPIIILKPNTDYIVSFDVVSMETTGSCTFRAYGINEDGNIELIFDKYFSSTGHHYQAFNSGKHSKVWLTFNGIFNSDDTSARKYVIYDNVQIEKGTVVSEYTPYKSLGYTSGHNENGSWVKYDDGRMEVQGIRTVPANTQAYTIVFPVSFVDDEYIVSLSYMFQYYFNVVMPLSNKNVNSINVHLFDEAGTELSNEQTIMFEVKGRWK